MIINSPTIKKALYFSAEKHNGQFRKGGNVPYIVHPVMVAWGVADYTMNEDIIAAALLHDTLEDCPDVSISILQREFGKHVADLVGEVSYLEEDGKTSSWKLKKESYLKKISTISNDALLIVAVDKMSNMYSYFEAVRKGIDVSKLSFGGTPEEYYWYYSEIAAILRIKMEGDKIFKDYTEILATYIKK